MYCVIQWIKNIHRFLQIFDLLLFCLSVYFYFTLICLEKYQIFNKTNHTGKKNRHSYSSQYPELEWILEILLEGANLHKSFQSYLTQERNLDIQLGKLREKMGKGGKKT